MVASISGRNLPPPQSPFVNPDGALSYFGYQYLLSLLNLAGSQTATASIAQNLKADGTNQATALPLTTDWNEVTTTPAGTGVLLQGRQAGQSQIIFNRGVNNLNVYPPPGSSIDGANPNVPFVLIAGDDKTFYFLSATDIT